MTEHDTSSAPRRNRRLRRAAAAAVAAIGLMIPVACSSSADDASTSGSANTINYWLWDSAQQPSYQKCADAFHQENPSLTVKITQMGWDNYWSKLTAGMIADRAPDVFTDHLNYFPQYYDLGVLRPLDEFEATKDINDADYQEGLAQLWKGQDGHRYGAPKDWDTIGFFYNTKMLGQAGITEQQMKTLTWNPTDGGTFEKVIAHLSIDSKGRRGDQPGFDKSHVKVYGFASGGSGAPMGQTQWGPFAGSLQNWDYTDKNPWGKKFRFDDPAFQQMLTWYFGLSRKGFMPPYATAKTLNAYQQFSSGMAAISEDGDWLISSYAGIKGVSWKLAPTPIGPSGHRASPFNGLADSVTKFAKNPEAAAKWVKFMSTEKCQDIIAKAGIVFPARPAATQISIDVRKKAGIDVTPFTDQVRDKTTFLIPVTQNAADISAVYSPTFDAIYLGQQPASALTKDTEQVNKLLSLNGS